MRIDPIYAISIVYGTRVLTQCPGVMEVASEVDGKMHVGDFLISRDRLAALIQTDRIRSTTSH